MADKLSEASYFFCGIGGSGMSALASMLARHGAKVSGSDRGYDCGQSPEKFARLEQEGIALYPQDGSGIHDNLTAVIVSSAVEDSIPDIKRAKEVGCLIWKRAYLLAKRFNESKGIAIGGTSGKTTVTAMTGYLMDRSGVSPTIVNGGVMVDRFDNVTATGNTVIGKEGGWFVAETDESDRSIDMFDPKIAVLTNISLDHRPLEELREIFYQFVKRAEQGIVLNIDDAETLPLYERANNAFPQKIMTVSLKNTQADLYTQSIKHEPGAVSFQVALREGDKLIKDIPPIRIKTPGNHNVSNALMAIAAAIRAGVPAGDACASMEGFTGVKRRMEVIGVQNDVTVIDDFAHNPDKIAASLKTLKTFEGRLVVIFQPHGFAPTKMMYSGLVETFKTLLDEDDLLLMPEIFYAGGTTDKDISSRDVIQSMTAHGNRASFFENRADIVPYLEKNLKRGDRIVIMGARDDTLTDLAKDIYEALPRVIAA